MSKSVRRFLTFACILCCTIPQYSCKNDSSIKIEDNYEGSGESEIQLELLPSEKTGVSFNNRLVDDGRLNVFVWNFLYTGAGVAAGDISGDGLPDLVFAGNQVDDKVYLNRGNFEFEDITEVSGITDRLWSTGVTMADVNGDGLLDIYICKNSPSASFKNNRNKLYINIGNARFTESSAEFGLDDPGFSIQATFFDFDQDGDLDMYLVNQPFDQFARLINKKEAVDTYPFTDRLYVQENGKFTDQTESMGLTNNRYGLNAILGDFDKNGWTDIYVCNDYHHADHLYMNVGGTFTDQLQDRTGHISFYSMGSDVADINSDGWLDISVLDMAFEDHYRSKTNMESMDTDRFWSLVKSGQHFQYAQNTLQLNLGKGYFADIAQLSGVHKTDWSGAPLFADLDIDGYPDLLITNGIYRDMKNNDFNQYVKEVHGNSVGPSNYQEIISRLPSNPVNNILYRNKGDLTFQKQKDVFNFNGFSHGMATADLDRDGKLDVIVNNMNAEASIYRNKSSNGYNHLTIELEGPSNNLQCLGCSVDVYSGKKIQSGCLQTSRGFLSACEPVLHFGLGNEEVDSLIIHWNARETTTYTNLAVNQRLKVQYTNEQKSSRRRPDTENQRFVQSKLIPFYHKETPFNDFEDQVLLPYKLSQNGPFIAIQDIDSDGLEDVFLSGAKGYTSQIFKQTSRGTFEEIQVSSLEEIAYTEQMEADFKDINKDGIEDLIVISGSNEFEEGSEEASDFILVGKGNFKFGPPLRISDDQTPINGQTILLFDADQDGDDDLFIGGRLIPGRYPIPPDSKILINENGLFKDGSSLSGDIWKEFALVTDGVVHDIDKDGDQDLLLVGEWMVPTWMINDGNGGFEPYELENVGKGIWWTVEKIDLDMDGQMDFLLGNLGWNNKFGGSNIPKLEVFAGDFDQNGDHDVVLAKKKNESLLPVRGRECSSEEMPFIFDKFPSFDAFGKAELPEILGEENLKNSYHSKIDRFSSILVRNRGSLDFEIKILPVECQLGAIKAFLVHDFNEDGIPDFLLGGNHYPTEVETARYDALPLTLCLGNVDSTVSCRPVYIDGHPHISDVRDLELIHRPDGSIFVLVAQNNREVLVLQSEETADSQ